MTRPPDLSTASPTAPAGAVAAPAVCESCGQRAALLELTYPGTDPFALCQGCVAPELATAAAGIEPRPTLPELTYRADPP